MHHVSGLRDKIGSTNSHVIPWQRTLLLHHHMPQTKGEKMDEKSKRSAGIPTADIRGGTSKIPRKIISRKYQKIVATNRYGTN